MEKKKRVLRNNTEKIKCNYRKKLSPKAKEMVKRQSKRRKSLPKEAKDMMLELDLVVYINRKKGCACYHLIDGDFKLIDVLFLFIVGQYYLVTIQIETCFL